MQKTSSLPDVLWRKLLQNLHFPLFTGRFIVPNMHLNLTWLAVFQFKGKQLEISTRVEEFRVAGSYADELASSSGPWSLRPRSLKTLSSKPRIKSSNLTSLNCRKGRRTPSLSWELSTLRLMNWRTKFMDLRCCLLRLIRGPNVLRGRKQTLSGNSFRQDSSYKEKDNSLGQLLSEQSQAS